MSRISQVKVSGQRPPIVDAPADPPVSAQIPGWLDEMSADVQHMTIDDLLKINKWLGSMTPQDVIDLGLVWLADAFGITKRWSVTP